MFGFGENQDDKAILGAVKKRLLRELKEKGASAGQTSSIINNVYGSGHDKSGTGGSDDVRGMMMEGQDPFDYLVDIERKDLPDINPHTGKPAGWTKKVHRYREKKG